MKVGLAVFVLFIAAISASGDETPQAPPPGITPAPLNASAPAPTPTPTSAAAPTPPAPSLDALSRWSLGATFDGVGGDWGSGLALQTPTFGKTGLGLEVAERIYNYSKAEDLRYAMLTFSLIGREPIAPALSTYMRIGGGIVLPDQALSSKVGSDFSAALGIELLNYRWAESFLNRLTFFGEIGAVIPIGNRYADQLTDSPTYGTGAQTTFGVRFYF